MNLSPEVAGAYVSRLDLLRELPVDARAHALGDAWFVLAAHSTIPSNSPVRQILRSTWSNLEVRIGMQSEVERTASIREFANGLRVTDETAGDFRFVVQIRERLPRITNVDIAPIDSAIRQYSDEHGMDRRPLTLGARVLIAAYLDLGQLDLERQREFGDGIIKANNDQLGTRIRHVIPAMLGMLAVQDRTGIAA